MNKVLLTVMIIISSTSLAGCAGEDLGSSNASISVSEASAIDDGEGLCGYGDEEECVTLIVSIDNVDSTEDFSTNMFYWEAVGSDGGLYSTPSVTGPDAIVAGVTASITLDFDVSNGVTLTTLRYSPILGNELSTSIPNYGTTVSFSVTVSVVDASASADGEGYCGYGDDEECHVFNVTIVNDGLVDFSTNMYNWDSLGDDGGTYSTPDVEGPDSITAGNSGTVMLSFDVINGVKLSSLSWDDYDNSVTGVSIPSY